MSMTNISEAPQSVDALIGERVHQLMWRHQVTQTALAPILGIGQTGLSPKLRGKRGWSTDDLVTIAQFFGVTVGYLFGETENPRHNSDGGDLVGPAGIEPTTSTVEYGRLAEVVVGPWTGAAA